MSAERHKRFPSGWLRAAGLAVLVMVLGAGAVGIFAMSERYASSVAMQAASPEHLTELAGTAVGAALSLVHVATASVFGVAASSPGMFGFGATAALLLLMLIVVIGTLTGPLLLLGAIVLFIRRRFYPDVI